MPAQVFVWDGDGNIVRKPIFSPSSYTAVADLHGDASGRTVLLAHKTFFSEDTTSPHLYVMAGGWDSVRHAEGLSRVRDFTGGELKPGGDGSLYVLAFASREDDVLAGKTYTSKILAYRVRIR